MRAMRSKSIFPWNGVAASAANSLKASMCLRRNHPRPSFSLRMPPLMKFMSTEANT